MNYSDYRFTLDIQIHQAQVSIPVTLNDTARKLCIGLTDGRKPYYIADGCRAVFSAKKPDGTTIFNDCIIYNNTTIEYEFSKNTTSCEGIVDCEIRLYDADGRELTSPQFIIVVDKKVMRDEEVAMSASEATTITNMIAAEQGRVVAENARVIAEEGRVAAENARVDADVARDEAVQEAIDALGNAMGMAKNISIKDEDGHFKSTTVEDALCEIAETFDEIAEDFDSLYGTGGNLTLTRSNFNSHLCTTANVPELGEHDMISISPATAKDQEMIAKSGLFVVSPTQRGGVEFRATSLPDADINLIYFIVRGK